MNMNNFIFRTVGTIINEQGGAANLGKMVAELGYQKVLLVSDSGTVKAGHLEKISAGLQSNSISAASYLEVGPDPSEEMVLAAVAAGRRGECQLVVGIGGGSAMDVAKAAAVLLRTNCSLADIYGIDQIRGGRLPLILVPATAGTGSEVTASSVISSASGKKNVAIDATLYPDIALLDVDMVRTMPRQIATTTGVDAVVHAIEAFTSATRKNPISDMLACEALRYLLNNLEPSIRDDAEDEIRSRVLLGAMLAGQAFANATVAAVHAFAYGLAEGFHLPHGLSNSLVMVPVLQYNAAKEPELYGQLAKNVFPENLSLGDAEAAEAFIARLRQLLVAVGLDQRLRDFGIARSDLPELARSVSGLTRLLNNNPRPIDYDGALQIFSEAY